MLDVLTQGLHIFIGMNVLNICNKSRTTGLIVGLFVLVLWHSVMCWLKMWAIQWHNHPNNHLCDFKTRKWKMIYLSVFSTDNSPWLTKVRNMLCVNHKLVFKTIFLTWSLIGSINDRIFDLTNRQVVLMGLRRNKQINNQHSLWNE